MTAPTGPVSLTFEEIEAQIAAGVVDSAKPKLDEIKIPDTAEGIPDELKGKSMAEIIKLAQGTGDALRASEARRLELERQAAAATTIQTHQAPIEPTPKETPDLTEEQVAELFQKSPLQAIAYMNAKAVATVEQNLTKRIGTLISGTVTSAEESARKKYPEEFSLFGDQIGAALKTIVNKDAMSQPQAWDDLIAWIRGKPENFDRLLKHRADKQADVAAAAARAAQAAAAGPATQSVTRAPAGGGQKSAEGLDSLEMEIAEKMGMTYADYAKWKKVA